MAGNSIGEIFTLTTFGESHGEAIGGVIDGCPCGITIDVLYIQQQLNRRRPGQSTLTTSRKEQDEVYFLSGIYNGVSTGTPIGFMIKNTNQHSSDYKSIEEVYRPSHADYTYDQKYGIRDHRGGGRSSARETVSRVVAGAIAQLVLREYGISISAYTSSVGSVFTSKNYKDLDLNNIEKNNVRCPDLDVAVEMEQLISEVKASGDSIGGQITCVVKGVPTGLGEPVFDRLHANLAKAMLSINAAKGFEYGSGFEGSTMRGSAHNDEFYIDEQGNVRSRTNYSGGIQGGISNGEDIYFKVAFKPVATILQLQNTVNKDKENVETKVKGRHDPCVLPRAVPIVEAMAAMVIVDAMLLQKVRQ